MHCFEQTTSAKGIPEYHFRKNESNIRVLIYPFTN